MSQNSTKINFYKYVKCHLNCMLKSRFGEKKYINGLLET
jgi:hypothetical protein